MLLWPNIFLFKVLNWQDSPVVKQGAGQFIATLIHVLHVLFQTYAEMDPTTAALEKEHEAVCILYTHSFMYILFCMICLVGCLFTYYTGCKWHVASTFTTIISFQATGHNIL